MAKTFREFLRDYPTLVFKKGQTVLLKDETPKGVYIIESGFIKTYTINEAGEEHIISIDSRGEDVPIGFTFGLTQQCLYFYEAYSRCVVRIIPREAYLKHLKENPETLYSRHVRMTKLLLSNLKHVEALEQSKASDKVALTLLYLAETFGTTIPNKTVQILSVTQQEIANVLGLTRETAGIMLKKLEVKKLLVHSRHTYILYMDRMRKYLESSHR